MENKWTTEMTNLGHSHRLVGTAYRVARSYRDGLPLWWVIDESFVSNLDKWVASFGSFTEAKKDAERRYQEEVDKYKESTK